MMDRQWVTWDGAAITEDGEEEYVTWDGAVISEDQAAAATGVPKHADYYNRRMAV